MPSEMKFLKSLLAVLLVAGSFSACSKKPSGVRAQVKTQRNDLNGPVSQQADAQGAALNANYRIATVSVPNQTDAGVTIDVQLTTPDGLNLPVTTHHENGQLDSQGIYSDTARNLQIYVQARCSADNCAKYLLMISAVRNQQVVYQSVALSYKDDCKFYALSSSTNAGSFYYSLDEAETRIAREYPNAVPRNDAVSGACPAN